MKIIFAGITNINHIIVSLSLVRELVRRKHSVSYISTEMWHNDIENSGASFIPYDNYPVNPDKKSIAQLNSHLAVKTLIRVENTCDCIIYDADFFAGNAVCEKFNKKAVRIYFDLVFNHSVLKQIKQLIPFKERCRLTFPFSRSIAKKYTCSPIHVKNGFAEIATEHENELNISFTSNIFQPDGHIFQEDKYVFTGPVFDYRKISCIIPFSTMPGAVIFVKLDYNPGNKFFYKFFEAFSNTETSVILSINDNINVNELTEIPENFYIYPSIPPKEVLEHTDIFITDGNFSRINQALFYGVPMLILCNNKIDEFIGLRLEQLLCGKRFYPEDFDNNLLRSTVASILKNSKMLDEIIVIEAKTKMLGGVTAAADAIEKFIIPKI